MPIGVLINSISILLGGIAGAFLGNKVTDEWKSQLNLIFAVCSMGMGVVSIQFMQAMPAVIFALIVGSLIGFALHLGQHINKLGLMMQELLSNFFPRQKNSLSEQEFSSSFLIVIVLFCASGTGIYGSLDAGMTGDSSILLSKSILDFFTALLFACNLGTIVSLVAIPQFIIFTILFYMARFILPLTSPEMIADFKACGGFIMLATGFRMAKLKDFPIADMIPTMILVMPFSWIWNQWITPLF
ncbi:DUF554 domain-containing protein [Streptococcus cameli]